MAHRDPPPPPPPHVPLSVRLRWKDSLMHKVFTAALLECHDKVLQAVSATVISQLIGSNPTWCAHQQGENIQCSEMNSNKPSIMVCWGKKQFHYRLPIVLLPLPINPSLTCGAHHFIYTGITIVLVWVEHILQQQSMKRCYLCHIKITKKLLNRCNLEFRENNV